MDYRNNNNHPGDLYDTVYRMPKIELHRHFEGSLRLKTMSDIAHRFEMDLPGSEIEDFRHLIQMVPEDKPLPKVFLSKFRTLRQFFRSPEVIDRLTYEIIADAAAENIVYMELRFTPMALAAEGGYTLPEVIGWVTEATHRASADYGIEMGLIVSMNRHESVEIGDWCVEVAIDHMDDGIVGVDLAGDETKYPGKPFEAVFQKARDAGLAVTIHAGEWAGPPSVLEAVDVLGATRIGHGVRLIEDKGLLKMCCERDITLEICPTSNVQSGVFPTYSVHPLREMYRLCPGQTTINSDDPSISGINLTDELVYSMQHLGFSLYDIKQNTINAARAAFLPDDKRQQLVGRLVTQLFSEEEEEPVTTPTVVTPTRPDHP